MALVNDDAIIPVHRHRLGIIRRIENAFDHALHRRDVQAGVGFGPQVAQFLDVIDVGKCLQVFQPDVLQFIDCLLAEGVTVDEEQNAAETL